MSNKTRSRTALPFSFAIFLFSGLTSAYAAPINDPLLSQAAAQLGLLQQPPARQNQTAQYPATNNTVKNANYYAIKRQQQLRENLARRKAHQEQLKQVYLQRGQQNHSHQASNGANNNVWSRIYNGFRFRDYNHQPLVKHFVNQYSRYPQNIERHTERAQKYLFMVVNELNRRQIPTELALLPFIESSYRNKAFSHAGAAGMWQFIPSTGRIYGLKQTRSYDARLDSFEATRAALDYLQKLNREFNGDWLLSLAAYNVGENRIHREIAANRARGRRTDYWSLNLPKETKQYVPRLLAMKEILRNPQRYRVRLRAVPNTPLLTTIRVNKPVNLMKVAAKAGLPSTTLAALNPSYLHGITTPRFSNRIILPRKHAGRLNHVIQRLPPAVDVHQKPAYRFASSSRYKKSAKRGRYITHRVKRGDNLFRIALKHGTTVKKIKRLNKLRNNNITPGEKLKITASARSRNRKNS